MVREVCSIGVDIGTTSVKVIAFVGGTEFARASRRVKMCPGLEEGASEQNVTAVYGAVMDALHEVMDKLHAVGIRIQHVGFSAAMHSLLAVDPQGRPMTGAMTWMDVRANREARELWKSPEGPDLYQRTGTPIHPMSPFSKLIWLRREKPQVFAEAARFVSIKEWVWYQWFGEWVIDHSMASATGLFDIRRQVWDEEALKLAGIGPERLSRPVPTSYCRNPESGSPLAEIGLDASVSVNIGASDGVLANLGAGVIDSRAMVLTIGTSCAVRVGSSRPLSDLATRPFSYILSEGRYVVGAPSNSGGVVLDHLHQSVLNSGANATSSQSLPELLEQAGRVEADNLLYLPYVAGERAPLWNAEATGAILGLTTRHRAEHVLRAAVEGVLLNAYWMAARLMEDVGRPERLIACGKLFDFSWTRQLLADLFGLQVQTADAADASTLGAALLAEVSSGWRDWTKLPTPASDVSHTPDTERHRIWLKRVERFQQAAVVLGLTENGR
jgi:gluconokinase